MSRTTIRNFLACVVIFGAGELHADEVTFHVEAEFFSSTPALAAAGLAEGSTMTLSYTFDSETPDSLPDNNAQASYRDAISSLVYEIELAGVAVAAGQATGGNITIADGIPSDVFTVASTRANPSHGLTGEVDGLNILLLNNIFTDTDGTIYSGDSLPVSPPPIEEVEIPTVILLYESEMQGGSLNRAEYRVTSVTGSVPGITVTIDVKPGSDPNCFNNDGHGVIPVAILGDSAFDVTAVDTTTVELDGLGLAVRGKSKLMTSLEDVNNDGFTDLVLQFEDEDGVYAQGVGEASVTGALLDGTLLEGTDTICVTQ